MCMWRRTRYIHVKYRPQSLSLISTLHQPRANDLEEQLKCEEVTAVAMAERLKMMEDELLYLKSKVNDLEEPIQVLIKRNIFRNRIVCVSVVLFIVLIFSLGKGKM
ncbi:GTP-binding protein HSR1-like protein, partial [Striga asiatica]